MRQKEVKWRYGFQLLQKTYEKEQQNPKKKKKKIKVPKAMSTKLSGFEKGLMTKVEQKALREEQKRVLKEAWSSMSDNFG